MKCRQLNIPNKIKFKTIEQPIAKAQTINGEYIAKIEVFVSPKSMIIANITDNGPP